MTGIAPKIDPWEQLTKIAREIQPDLPADLSGYEVRITLNKDFQAVELMALDFIDKRLDSRASRIRSSTWPRA